MPIFAANFLVSNLGKYYYCGSENLFRKASIVWLEKLLLPKVAKKHQVSVSLGALSLVGSLKLLPKLEA